jgi:hypothetical protein
VPALLGASTSATNLLRGLGIEPGFGQLFNFCSRAAAFGDRLAGKASELFQAPRDAAQQSEERAKLQRDIVRWCTESAQRAAGYARSSQLFLHAHWTVLASPARKHAQIVHEWAKWQDVLLLAHRLVRPARDGVESERNWVQQEIARLTAMIKSDEPASNPRHAGWDAGMRAVLVESIDLANRCLRLQAATPSRSRLLAPQVDELRIELVERAPAVLAELAVAEQQAATPLARCGVSCCRDEVLRIRDLCSGSSSLPIHEATSKQALCEVWLKLGDVPVNDRGEPLGDPRRWERRLLEHLSTPQTFVECAAPSIAALNDLETSVF